VLFAGVTNAPCNCFTTNGDGGTWIARIDRTDSAGIGANPSSIVGGKLLLETGDLPRIFKFTGGAVTWPTSLQQDIGCGPGVATFVATLTHGRSLAGCLDDTHLNPLQQPFVFPPRIWGTLQ
jgi:hypothetical protein